MKTSHITTHFNVKRMDSQGTLAGYASIFHVVDEQKDSVLPGAFKDSLLAWEQKKKLPKMLWQHDSSAPIGVWQFIEEDEKGLYVEGKLILDTQKSREVYALLKEGALEGLSIGYRVQESQKGEGRVRELTKVDLFEISVVTFAANPLASVTHLKGR